MRKLLNFLEQDCEPKIVPMIVAHMLAVSSALDPFEDGWHGHIDIT